MVSYRGLLHPPLQLLCEKHFKKIWGFVFFLIILLVGEEAWSGHLIFSLTCLVCGQNIALPISPSVGTIPTTFLKGEQKLNGKRREYLSLLKPGNGNSKTDK